MDSTPEELNADHPLENGDHADSEPQDAVMSPDVLSSESLPADSGSDSHEEDAPPAETVAPSSKDSETTPKSPTKLLPGKATSSSVKKVSSVDFT